MRQLTLFIQCSTNFKNRMGYSWRVILGSCSWKFDFSKNSREHIRINYSIEKMVAVYLDLIEKDVVI